MRLVHNLVCFKTLGEPGHLRVCAPVHFIREGKKSAQNGNLMFNLNRGLGSSSQFQGRHAQETGETQL